MKFLIKEISPSKKEIRLTLNTVNLFNTPHYVFGGVETSFDEGSISTKYIPHSFTNFLSTGPNPAIIRLIVAYLKDTL